MPVVWKGDGRSGGVHVVEWPWSHEPVLNDLNTNFEWLVNSDLVGQSVEGWDP